MTKGVPQRLGSGSETRLIVLIMLLVGGITAFFRVTPFGVCVLGAGIAMTVVISCSASFVTPVSSTWNLLVMEPGGYSFGDYVKVGLPLLLLTMLITVTLVRLIYRF